MTDPPAPTWATARQARPLRVALTGGIATGKSYCLARFIALGAPAIDADVLARDAVAPGSSGLDAVVSRFGPALRRPDGTLDRDALARIVFADSAARRDLDTIVHPIVYAAIRDFFLRLARAASPPRVAIADVPLLYETGYERAFDRVVVAYCRPEQQLARLMARNHLSEEQACARIDSQMPIDAKAARADYVIDTSRSFAETDALVDDLWRKLNSLV